jgi:hypothetical protein
MGQTTNVACLLKQSVDLISSVAFTGAELR